MIRKYVAGDIDSVMQIWLNTNIQAHSLYLRITGKATLIW